MVESGISGPNFAACGYDLFNSYDPAGRVQLVDLGAAPYALIPVPGGGLTYGALYLPDLLLADGVYFISAAKLKTHYYTHVTLSMKNLMGLPVREHYQTPEEQWRFAIHERGISQALVDLNRARPVDFAVVDGIVGLEGMGPVLGKPLEMGLVFAGPNAVAVDRVCCYAMRIPQVAVKHLILAARAGLGPGRMSQIEVLGAPWSACASPGPICCPRCWSTPVCGPGHSTLRLASKPRSSTG